MSTGGVAGVECFAYDGNISELWEVGSEETSDFTDFVCHFEEFVPVGDTEYGEVACGTVEKGSMMLLHRLT